MKEVQFQSEYGYKQDRDTEQRQNRSEEEKLKRKENAVERVARMRMKDVEGEKVAH